MKRLTEQDYYTLLGISPKASFEEVRSAYDEAVNVYSADSVATYSLFTEEERERILSHLLDAYKTLTDTQLRREYNHSLIEKGALSPHDIGFPSPENSDGGRGRLREVTVDSLLQEEKTSYGKQPPHETLDLFDGQTPVTGRSIRMLRAAREITFEEIYKKTNIPKKTLEDIEEEKFAELPALAYLKGFLKAYAKVLDINESQIVDGYVKRYLEWKTTSQR